MSKESFEYTITDPMGLHARPAGVLVKLAAKHPCQIMVSKGDLSADAKKMLRLMKLGVKCGETIVISAEGEGSEQAIAELKTFAAENL